MDIAAVGLNTYLKDFIARVTESYRNGHPSYSHIELAWHLNDLHTTLISQGISLSFVNRIRTRVADVIVANAS